MMDFNLNWNEVMWERQQRRCVVLDRLLDLLWRRGFHRVVHLDWSKEIAGSWRVRVGPYVEVRREPWAESGIRWIVSGVPHRKAERGTLWTGLEAHLESKARTTHGRDSGIVELSPLGTYPSMHHVVLDWCARADVSEDTRGQYERRLVPMIHDYGAGSGALLEVLESCLEQSPSSALRYRKRFVEDLLDSIGRDYGLLEGLELQVR